MTTQAKTAQSEWDRVLAEQADSPEQFATVVPDSYLREGEVLGPVNDSNPAPSRLSSLRFKGYVEVWDTRTGVKSLQPWWLLWQTMKKKREDGSFVFTRTDPKIPPNYGADLVCPLNPASSEYETVKGMGFKVCTKQHIPHEDARMRHVKKSHSRAWEAMERIRTERIRQEDRKLQQDMLAAMTAAAVRGVSAPAPLPGVEVVDVVHGSTVQEDPTDFIGKCAQCGKAFSGQSEAVTFNKIRLHHRASHRDVPMQETI